MRGSNGRFRFAAIGAIAAMVLGGGQLMTASAAVSPDASSLVTITPCRLFDTRPDEKVGTRATPIGAGETFVATVWGTNGNCTIPSGVTGVSLSVVSVNPSAASFLTVFPADVTRPRASNLNWVAGQPPTPSAVTVKLSADGRIALYNLSGTVDLLVDIVGYYEPSGVADRYTKGEVDAKLTPKANAADVYTKTQTDALVAGAATPPFVQTGSGANDPFIVFNGAAFSLDSACGDPEGCRITLLRQLGGAITQFGPITMRVAGTAYWFGTGGVLAAETSSNGQAITILGNPLFSASSCTLSDWDSSGSDATGDQNTSFGIVRFNATATPLTCTIKVED